MEEQSLLSWAPSAQEGGQDVAEHNMDVHVIDVSSLKNTAVHLISMEACGLHVINRGRGARMLRRSYTKTQTALRCYFYDPVSR